MTEREARALYRSGEEPTVNKLLLLDKEVEELKKIIHTLKDDPSKPSAMKAPYEKPSPKGRKKRPGRKKAHQGVQRPPPLRIDKTEVHTISQCPECSSLLKEPVSKRERFSEDIPKVEPVIKRHIINIYWCRRCKKVVEAPCEDVLPKSTLGNRLLAHTAYLHFYLGLPLHKVVKYLTSCLYSPVSAGGLSSAWARLSKILSPWYEYLRMLAKESPLLHIDETGWRVVGKTYWLWCFASEKVAYYLISPSRASPILREVLGEFFKGILVCDFFGAYNRIGALFKQRCLLHILRDIVRTSVFCHTPCWLSFLKRLKRLIKDAISLGIKGDSLAPLVYARRCETIHRRLNELIREPYQDKHCLRLIKRLKRHQDELFTFLKQKGVPFENNHAERMIRPPVYVQRTGRAVVARKNSYCNRSEKGAKTQAILMSIFQTLHLRKQDPITALEEALRSYCRTGSLPSLFEEPEVQLSMAS